MSKLNEIVDGARLVRLPGVGFRVGGFRASCISSSVFFIGSGSGSEATTISGSSLIGSEGSGVSEGVDAGAEWTCAAGGSFATGVDGTAF
ncbi:MAG TPA: hypothetical protein DCX14_15655 [Flavobacteriales bacterium]|nr:hypothetical protein [Flavobacteriales bacterium]